MHHANGKLPLVAAAAPNHTPPYESLLQSKSPEYGSSSNAGYIMIAGRSPAWLHQKEPLSLRSKERAHGGQQTI